MSALKARLQRLVILVAVLGLSACISSPPIGGPTQAPADVEDRAVVNGKVLPLPESSQIRTESLSSEPPVSAVVKRLMASAKTQSDQENWDDAASSLERAIRIEPRNAALWGRLADVRFSQKAWRKAIQLAAKSNTLTGDNENLQRRNWYLIANAHDALGEPEKAQKYRAKLSQ